jgi:hypothetical protein
VTPQLEQLREQITAKEQATIEAYRRHSGVTHAAGELFKNYEAAARQAKAAANGARSTVERLRADDTIPADSRRRQVREALATGRADVKRWQDRMDDALVVLKAHLAVDAVPRVDPKRETPAREELRMVLDGAVDPVATMIELAQHDDELGAAAASSYGESYLRAKGTPKAKEAHQQVRAVAAASARFSNDPTRRAIGEAHGAVGELDKAMGCTHQIARADLEAAEEAAQALLSPTPTYQ